MYLIFSIKCCIIVSLAPIAQLDRASDYESEGWGFESLLVHQTSTNIYVLVFYTYIN